MIYKTKTLANNNQNILLVAKKIKAGNVIALPTETVYGLAGRFDNDLTIKKIFSIKTSKGLVIGVFLCLIQKKKNLQMVFLNRKN